MAVAETLARRGKPDMPGMTHAPTALVLDARQTASDEYFVCGWNEYGDAVMCAGGGGICVNSGSYRGCRTCDLDDRYCTAGPPSIPIPTGCDDGGAYYHYSGSHTSLDSSLSSALFRPGPEVLECYLAAYPLCVTWLWSSEAGNPTIPSYSYFSCAASREGGQRRKLLPESPTADPTSTRPTITVSLISASDSATHPVSISNSEASTPKIIGGVIGGVILLLLAGVGALCLRRRRMKMAALANNEPKDQKGSPIFHELNGGPRAVEIAPRSEMDLHSQQSGAEAFHLSPAGPVADQRPLTESSRGPLSAGAVAMSPISELDGGH